MTELTDPILDFHDGRYVLKISRNISSAAAFRVRLLTYFDKGSDDDALLMKDGFSFSEVSQIVDKLTDFIQQRGLRLIRTPAFEQHLQAVDQNISERRNVGSDIKERREGIKCGFEEYRRIVNNELVRPLRDKQMWDSYFMSVMKKSGNFSVPGSGKTATTLGMFAFYRSQGRLDRILLIGPKNCFGSWLDEYHECFGAMPNYFNIHEVLGDSQDKRNELILGSLDRDFYMFNYESVGKYAEVLKRYIVNDRTMVILDEAHRIKAVNGKYAKDVLDIVGGCEYIAVLTGTPIPNTYRDIFNFTRIVFGEHRRELFGFTPAQLKNPLDREVSEINDSIYPFFCRTTKDELGVPPINQNLIYRVQASDSENRLLNELFSRFYDERLALIIRTLQLESDPRMLGSMLSKDELDCLELEKQDVGNLSALTDLIFDDKPTAKTVACVDTVSELVRQGKKVIVWAIFIRSIDNLFRMLEERGVKVRKIYGEVSLDDRGAILDEFRRGEFNVLIANPHTLAESVSLHTVCHDAVYFEYSYNLVHFLQSKDRIHRLGLPDDQYTQLHIMMTCFGDDDSAYSLDGCIYERLNEKEAMMIRAIEDNRLESLPSQQDDVDSILDELFNKRKATVAYSGNML